MWQQVQATSVQLGALPMEVLQASFWSLDKHRTVAKFAEFAELAPGSPEARRFVELEDWANEGEPLPYPAARELIEDMFVEDLPGSGRWLVGGKAVSDLLSAPVLHLVSEKDRIAPAATAPEGPTVTFGAGHVGMVVGSARAQVHQALAGFLDPACR
jgi:polyhydroxyalkanoate synthase